LPLRSRETIWASSISFDLLKQGSLDILGLLLCGGELSCLSVAWVTKTKESGRFAIHFSGFLPCLNVKSS
jgi:hypothetical protein